MHTFISLATSKTDRKHLLLVHKNRVYHIYCVLLSKHPGPVHQPMEQALEEALKALDRGEVPVGCVLQTSSGETVAVGSNRTNELGNATSHAEMVAFEALSYAGHRPHARSLTLYVTCEPCIMCASAIVQIGVVGRVVFGCHNPRFGGCGSVRGLEMYGGNVPEVVSGVRKGESVRLLGMFYERTNPNAPRPKKKRKKAGADDGKESGNGD